MIRPALALLEFDSVAVGIEAGDAMAKRSALRVLLAGTVHPGKYLVLVGGEVADVEEAVDAGLAMADGHLIDRVVLPDVDERVVAGVAGDRAPSEGEALGIIETSSAAATIHAADAGVKGAAVSIRQLRLADDLGGKGYVLFGGPVGEVEAAVEIGSERVTHAVVATRVIAQLHEEMDENLEADARFGPRMSGS